MDCRAGLVEEVSGTFHGGYGLVFSRGGKREEIMQVARASFVGESERTLGDAVDGLDHAQHSAKVELRVADGPGPRVGGHDDQGHAESELIISLAIVACAGKFAQH